MNEQVLNAEDAKKHHLAIVLEQDNLSAKILLDSIDKLMKEKDNMVKRAIEEGYNPDRNSSVRIVKILEDLVS